MRSYPHKPKEELLAESLKNSREDYESARSKTDQGEAKRSAIFFKRQGDTAMEVAALEYAFGADWSDVRQWLDSSCDAAQKAVEYGVELDPVLYMTFLALAILCSNEVLLGQLKARRRSDFTDSTVKADEVFYLAAEAMRDIAAGLLEDALRASEAGLARLGDNGPNPGAKLATEAILMLEEATAQKDQTRLIVAVQARSEKNKTSYSKPAARNFPGGLLDVVGLGLLKLARDNGLSVPDDSVYLPTRLLEQ
jgi:hypothetical protein